MKQVAVILGCVFSMAAWAQGPETPNTMQNPKQEVREKVVGTITNAKVFFIEPKDGATVKKNFKIVMGTEGVRVRPAGESPDDVTIGHHHIIIDDGPIAAGQAIPND